MTNSEPNPRLNVPIKLVANPTGDFAVAGGVLADTSAGGAVEAVSQLQNLAAPVGDLTPTAAAVTATSDLSFSTTGSTQTGGDLAIPAPKLVGESDAGLNLAPPKFTY